MAARVEPEADIESQEATDRALAGTVAGPDEGASRSSVAGERAAALGAARVAAGAQAKAGPVRTARVLLGTHRGARTHAEWALARAGDAYQPYARGGPAPVGSLGGSRPVPEMPVQCSKCQRWLGRERLAIMPIGASPWCSLCHALDQLPGAIRESRISLEQEEEVLTSLFQAHQGLRGQ